MEKMLLALNFLVLNCAIFASAVFCALIINGYVVRDKTKLFLQSVVLFVTFIVGIQFILGTFAGISFLNVSVFAYGLFFIFGMIFYKNRARLKIVHSGDSPNILLLLAVFAPIAWLLLARVFNALFEIPLEYDSVAYHLPFVMEWLQTGSLRELYYSAFAGPISYYPSTYELLDLWVIMPFKSDFLVNVLNAPLLIVFAVLMYKILQNLKISKNVAIVSTALLFYMPVFLRQVGVPLVDLFFTLAFAFGIYFLQEIYKQKSLEEGSRSDIFLFGLSIGLCVGTKYLGLVMVPPLVILLLILLIKYRKKGELATNIYVFITGAFITGAFFYIRNWITSGNPLFPVDVRFAGLQLFEGYAGINDRLVSSSLFANVRDFSALKLFVMKYFSMVGLHGLAIFVVGAILLATVVYDLAKKQSREGFVVPILLLLGMALYFGLYIKAPYSFQDLVPNVRYSMPFLLIGILSMGYIVNRIHFLRIPFYIGSVISMGYTFTRHTLPLDFSVHYNHRVIFVLFLLAAIGLVFALFAYVKSKKKISVICIVMTLSVIGFITPQFLLERENLAPYFAKTWFGSDPVMSGIISSAFWLDTQPEVHLIAYSGFNYHYHLYGRNLERDVDYVNINDCLDCRYAEFKNATDSIRTNPNFDAWFTNLQNLQKQYLVVQPTYIKDVKNYEFEWANEHPENFQKAFENNGTYVYKIVY